MGDDSGADGDGGGRPGGERLSRREVFSGRVVDLSVDRVRLPNGRESDLELLHFAGAACVLPLLPAASGGGGGDDQSVLLVRQYRYPTGGWLLEAPAGKIDDGEDPAETARRELIEETGFRAGELEPLGWVWSTPGAADERIWLFAARDLEAGDDALEDDEVLEPVRLPLAEAIRRAEDGDLRDAKTVCALLRLAARRRRAGS